MAWVYIGLGSNLSHPKQQLDIAIFNLRNQPWLHDLIVSNYYGSKPQGPEDQPDFVNAVAGFETSLDPYELLSQLQRLELEQGKDKIRHWGERLIDLDILLYDQIELNESNLKIPHPFIPERDFVLLPLQEIAPRISIPNQPSLNDLIDNLTQTFVYPLNEKMDTL